MRCRTKTSEGGTKRRQKSRRQKESAITLVKEAMLTPACTICVISGMRGIRTLFISMRVCKGLSFNLLDFGFGFVFNFNGFS
ncbi:hypothetical protein Mapa_004873 [Marchantia paleacea]|nr:hypothetical protein Mapa_004873 [Marchantia paleacea]